MADEQTEWEGTVFYRTRCPPECTAEKPHWHWRSNEQNKAGLWTTFADIPPDRQQDLEYFSKTLQEVQASVGRMVEIIVEHLMKEDGHLTISVNRDRADPVVVGCEFGHEAEDSPMAGGASYGMGETVEQALTTVLSETGWDNG